MFNLSNFLGSLQYLSPWLFLVSEYDIEPRDAAGLVMNSPLTQELYSSEEPITDQKVKALAEKLLACHIRV